MCCICICKRACACVCWSCLLERSLTCAVLWCVHVEEQHSSLHWMWTSCGRALPYVGAPSFGVSFKCRPSPSEVIAQACLALANFFRSSYFKAQIQTTFALHLITHQSFCTKTSYWQGKLLTWGRSSKQVARLSSPCHCILGGRPFTLLKLLWGSLVFAVLLLLDQRSLEAWSPVKFPSCVLLRCWLFGHIKQKSLQLTALGLSGTSCEGYMMECVHAGFWKALTAERSQV